jgi:hypothetical protein
MGKRLYYGKLLKAMHFFPEGAVGIDKPRFRLSLHHGFKYHGTFEGNTPDEVIAKVKEAGWQVWGEMPLDYLSADNALDYVLYKHYMMTVYGMSETEAENDLQMRNTDKS